MHRHLTDPRKLSKILPEFFGGEFIVKKGRGKDTLVYCGKTERVTMPNPLEQVIYIHSAILYERYIGCERDYSPVERWKEVAHHSGVIHFEYSWYYRQPSRARLKLDAPERHDRCWICAYTDPIHLELFRTMLQSMFLKESLQKEPLFTRFRNLLLK